MEVENFNFATKNERLTMILQNHMLEEIDSEKLERHIRAWNKFYIHYPELICRIVCDIYCVSYEDFSSINQKNEYVEPRQLCFYYFRTMKKCSFQLIADHFNKNHATVIFGNNKMKNYIGNRDKELYPKFIEFQTKLMKYEEYL